MRGESNHNHATSNKVSTTSLRNENQSERKTVQTAGQRGPDGGVGTAVEHPSSDPADSTLRTNLRLRLAGQYLLRKVGTYRMGGHSRGKIGDAPM